jgi:hypothetical protein
MNSLRFSCLLALVIPVHVFAADSYIRLTCDEADKGSEVILDGDFKGKCPLDLTTKPGSHRLEVVTKKDGQYSLVYAVDVPLGAGVAQRIELPSPPAFAQAPEWSNFFLRKTPYPALMRAVKAGNPVAKAELARDYMTDAKGCYFDLNMPEDMHSSITSWTGGCKDGAGSGPGELVWSANGIPAYGRRMGTFVQGKLEGKGKDIFYNGENFEGMFAGGQKRGQGVQLYASGDRYEGDFQDWKTTVKGVLVKKNGDRYEGEFRNGQMNGKGLLIGADGSRKSGKFDRDKFIGPE